MRAPARYCALQAITILSVCILLNSACDSTPIEPRVPVGQPPDRPLDWNMLPAVPDGAVTYYQTTASRWSPPSRYVLLPDSRFDLQFLNFPASWEHDGNYERLADTAIRFRFHVRGEAFGTLSDSMMTVTYDIHMALSDFEDAVYVRRSTP